MLVIDRTNRYNFYCTQNINKLQEKTTLNLYSEAKKLYQIFIYFYYSTSYKHIKRICIYDYHPYSTTPITTQLFSGTKKPRYTRLIVQVGALREIRTPDPLVRSQVLYPAEL